MTTVTGTTAPPTPEQTSPGAVVPCAPAVTVVVAAMNEERYVSSAIESILAQEDVDFELIFVDDGSSDNTLSIAQSYAQKNPRMRVVPNPKKGKCSAFNHGLALGRGRFSCIFAGDDLMPAGSLAARYAKVADFDDEQPVVGLSKLMTFSENKRLDGIVIPRGKDRGGISGVSPLMNRQALAFMFPVPEHLPNEDTWMALAVLHLSHFRIVHSDIVACHWRAHSGNSRDRNASFADNSNKYGIRMQALALFYEKYAPIMNAKQRKLLHAKVCCESSRQRGSIVGVLFSGAGLVETMRALSFTSPSLYSLRNRFYTFFSGW